MLTLTLQASLIGFGGTRVLKCSSRTLMGSKVSANNGGGRSGSGGGSDGDMFPWFLPKEVHKVKDPLARTLAQRIQRLPVQVGFPESSCIMSSCVKPMVENNDTNPVVLLHCFDRELFDLLRALFNNREILESNLVKPSSCLEWRCTYPLLEEAGVETWAIDVLGWGFSDLEKLPSCNVASKRQHLYQLWKSHIKRPMILVGPSLGAAVAIDFAVNFPEAVHKLVLINASVYQGTGSLQNLPRMMAYAMVCLLKSIPLRVYAMFLIFDGISLSTILDWTTVSRLHCLLPWWEDATVNYMLSGGYNVTTQIKQVQQRVLVLWGECDSIISSDLGERLQKELRNATLHQIPNCGHLPHVEKPDSIAKWIVEFAQEDSS